MTLIGFNESCLNLKRNCAYCCRNKINSQWRTRFASCFDKSTLNDEQFFEIIEALQTEDQEALEKTHWIEDTHFAEWQNKERTSTAHPKNDEGPISK